MTQISHETHFNVLIYQNICAFEDKYQESSLLMGIVY